MNVDFAYALGALMAVFIPLAFAWAIVRWTSRRHRDGGASTRWRERCKFPGRNGGCFSNAPRVEAPPSRWRLDVQRTIAQAKANGMKTAIRAPNA